AAISSGEQGGSIAVSNKEGQQVVNIGTYADGAGKANVARKDGSFAIGLGANDQGGFASVSNAHDKECARIYADNTELGHVMLSRLDGEIALDLKATAGGGTVGAYNDQDKLVGFLGSSSDRKSGLFFVSSPSGERGVEIGVGDSGGRVSVENDGGKEVVY